MRRTKVWIKINELANDVMTRVEGGFTPEIGEISEMVRILICSYLYPAQLTPEFSEREFNRDQVQAVLFQEIYRKLLTIRMQHDPKADIELVETE